MLRVLIVSDDTARGQAMLAPLSDAAFDIHSGQVATAEEFSSVVASQCWELILFDLDSARVEPAAALSTVASNALDIPVIAVADQVDERAVAALKAGVHDFVPRRELSRLASAAVDVLAAAKRRRTEALGRIDLLRAQESLRLMVESIRDHAIYMLDSQGRFVGWNGGAERMSGWREPEIIGQSFAIFFSYEDRAAGRPESLLRDARRDGSHRSEGWRVRKNGTRYFAEESIDGMFEGSAHVGYVLVVRDVTERHKLMNDLRQAVTARDDFLTIASHELKTPLTSLQLRVQRLQRALTRGNLDVHALPAALSVIMRSSHRLTELIDSLLDVNRINNDRLQLCRDDLDLTDVVRSVMDAHAEAIARSGSTVAVDSAGPIAGRWDRLRLETVVANLLGNALKYGRGQPIALHVDRAHDRARLRVCDHGIGIPPEEQARIFQRFERAVPQRHYGGFGLGLWIVRQIVDAHGGEILVESSPGEGSTFTVELPLS